MANNEPKDITNVMIMEAIHGIKTDVCGIKQEMKTMENRLENRMDTMENRLEERIVYESDCLAKAMVPTNRQLSVEIKSIKQHVGLVS